jgi:hypothetical protein
MDRLLGMCRGDKNKYIEIRNICSGTPWFDAKECQLCARHFVGFRTYPTKHDAPLRRNKAPLDRRSLSQQPYLVHCAISKSLLVLFRSTLYTQKTSLTRSEVHTLVMSGLSGSVAKVSDLYSVHTRFQSRWCKSPTIQGVTSRKTASCCILSILSQIQRTPPPQLAAASHRNTCKRAESCDGVSSCCFH